MIGDYFQVDRGFLYLNINRGSLEITRLSMTTLEDNCISHKLCTGSLL